MERFREHEGARHIVLFFYNKAGSPSRRRQVRGKAEGHLATPLMTKTLKRSSDIANCETRKGDPPPSLRWRGQRARRFGGGGRGARRTVAFRRDAEGDRRQRRPHDPGRERSRFARNLIVHETGFGFCRGLGLS